MHGGRSRWVRSSATSIVNPLSPLASFVLGSVAPPVVPVGFVRRPSCDGANGFVLRRRIRSFTLRSPSHCTPRQNVPWLRFAPQDELVTARHPYPRRSQ